MAAAQVCAEGVSLRVQSKRQKIYAQESAILSVTVVGADDARNPPDLSSVRDFTVHFLDSSSRSQSNITIINGRMTRSSRKERLFHYALVPKRTGKLRAGPVRLQSGGRVLEDPGPAIQVTGIENQDFVIIRVVPSKTEVLVDEAFSVRLSVLVKRLPGRFRDSEPLDPRYPPSLTVPYLGTQPLEGLEAPDAKRVLGGLETRSQNTSGFAINDRPASSTSVFDMFEMFDRGRGRPLAKHALKKDGVTENGRSYHRYSLTLRYTPTEEGTHAFGPVLFKGPIISGVTADGKAKGKDIFAVGPAAIVRVVPPPEKGRPATYVGLVGTNVNVRATLDTQTCQVGDPLTLTLALTGSFRRETVRTPILGDRPEITRDFRVYDDTVQTVRNDNGVQWTFTIRPTTAGTIELPPLDIAYYDTAERAYKTLSTEPIPVQSRQGAQVDGGTIIGDATNTVVLGSGTDVDDLFVMAPLNVDPAGARSSPITPRGWHLLVILVGPLALALVAGGRLLRRHSAAFGALRRKQTVLSRFADGLGRAEQADSDPELANRELCAAIRLYLAWLFDVAEASLTPADAKRLLGESSMADEGGERLLGIFKDSFDAAYTGIADPSRDIARDCREAGDLVRAIHARRHGGRETR